LNWCKKGSIKVNLHEFVKGSAQPYAVAQPGFDNIPVFRQRLEFGRRHTGNIVIMTTQDAIKQAGPKYLALQNTLSQSEWALAGLPQITKRLQNAEAALKTTRENILKFDKRSKHQLEKFQNLQHHSVKRAWYRTTGKLEEKIQEEEKAWMKEFETVQSAKVRGEEQEKEVAEAKTLRDQAAEAKRVHEKAKKDLSNLLEQLFAGPTPSYPSEDEIEQSLVAARQQLDNISMLGKRQEYITKSLGRANQCLVAALQLLEASLQTNTFDLFVQGGYANWVIHSDLAQARDLAARAQFLVQEVRRIEPEIPHIGDIQIEQDNLVFNVIFDNIFTDFRVRQIIQDALAQVQRSAIILQQQVLPGVFSRNQAAQAQVESCQNEVRRLEKAMWNERSRIMTEIVQGLGPQQQGRNAGQSSEQPQARYQAPVAPPPGSAEPEESVDDEPPPPYSAQVNARR
jgi:hypothetical protein